MPPKKAKIPELLLTVKEKAFILALRHKFRHGRVTIMVRDGLLIRVEEAYQNYEMVDLIEEYGLDDLDN